MEMYEKHMRCKQNDDVKLYKIGMFAGMNHVTIKTLRHYDEQGLLKPAYIDYENGYRYYSLSQMADVSQILALKDMGFSLDEIREIRCGKSDTSILLKKKHKILEELAQLTAKLAKVESYLQDENVDFTTPVIVKPLPEVICATMSAVLHSYDDLFHVMPRMGERMEEQGCVCALPEYCFTQYLDDACQEDNIRVQVCESVTLMKGDTDELKFKLFEAEDNAACIYHKGSYATLSKTYQRLLSYIDDNGYEICGNIREVYIDGVWNKDDETEWLTELQAPIRMIKG
ncbi:MAG: MerR family transcriptional regulator [Lachnospiraceae bacterium]|nr:MerR family transcriptional regulator [Lachnospiraceae bacterium]